jgi:hypothetical protein
MRRLAYVEVYSGPEVTIFVTVPWKGMLKMFTEIAGLFKKYLVAAQGIA